MPPRPRRPPPAEPRTQRCRFADEYGQRCRRVATVGDGLCRQHALVIELELEGRAGEALGELDRLMSRAQPGSLGAVVASFASNVLGRIMMGHQQRQPQPQIPGSCPPHVYVGADPQCSRCGHYEARRDPRVRPPPRAAPAPDPTVAARMVMGFEPNEPLTAELVKARKRRLAEVFHPDRQGGSAAHMQRVNAAADVLLAKLS